jgi:tRNA_anti-like
MTPKRAIIILVLVAASVGGWYAYSEYNRGVESTAEESAAATLKAEQLVADFVADENAANAKYVGKVVQVTGTVKSVEGNTVLVEAGPDGAEVSCTFDAQPLARQATPVIIKGECAGFDGLISAQVQLVRCAIVE